MGVLFTGLDWVGRFTAVIFLFDAIVAIVALLVSFKWLFSPLSRLGNGLSKRKIAIFATGGHLLHLKILLHASKLFNAKT